jgi:glutathione S-transferase
MLTLYAFGPGANSMKPLLALHEKGLDFKYHLLNAAEFEHHEDWFKKVNARGQVPALDHDGRIITESTVICEYLEDVFPDQNPLRPRDPAQLAEMRVWTKWVDEYFCWCVSTIGWQRLIGPMTKSLSDEEFEEKVKRIPVPEQQVKWRTARNGFPQEVIDEEMRKIRVSVARLEETLSRQDYLVGNQFTLADVCNFAIANGMTKGYDEIVNETATPGLLAWIRRINDRPGCKAMFDHARQVMIASKKTDPALAMREAAN